jgi:putative flippase GtrA
LNLNPKTTAAGIAGAVTLVIVFVLGQLGVDIPADVAAAVTTIIAFVAAYLRSSDGWHPR